MELDLPHGGMPAADTKRTKRARLIFGSKIFADIRKDGPFELSRPAIFCLCS
jgi:hypothetical protein